MSIIQNYEKSVVLTQAQFLAREAAGTLEPGVEYEISDAVQLLTKAEFEAKRQAGELYDGCIYDIIDSDAVEDVQINGTSAVVDGVANIIIDDTGTSTSTTAALSAHMGKELQDQVNNLKAIGRFLAIWNCATGMPLTNPTQLPYTYHTGDYYRVGTISVGGTNYKPDGSTYTGAASTTTESSTVAIGYVYYYDGTTWLLQAGGGGGTVQDVQINGTSIVASGTGIANVPIFSSSAPGAVPAATNASDKFLKGDGTWAIPGGSNAENAINALDAAMAFTEEAIENQPVFEGSDPGLVPEATDADAAKFLRGDGTWADGSGYTLPIADTTTLGGIKSQTASGTSCPVVVSADGTANAMVTAAGIGAATSSHTHTAASIPGFAYTTTAPTAANTDGMKVAVLSSEPATKYDGWLYIVTE